MRIANSYDLVCVENLDLKEIARKGNHLGKRTNDNAYGLFLTMLDYKLSDRGKRLIRVDKWFPSSQICHICGHRNSMTKNLKLRKWTCPTGGEVHDRDLNAAINILNEGIRTFLAS